MDVEYRDCPGHEGYRVGSDGTVWSCWQWRGGGAVGRASAYFTGDRWKRLSPGRSGSGYQQVYLRGGRYAMVHKLVLQAFVGPKPAGMECRHLDGNRSNNRLDNLEWSTHVANERDKAAHGTLLRGERSPRAVLKDRDVAEIRRRCAAGERQRLVGKDFGINQSQVSAIVLGKRWRHVA